MTLTFRRHAAGSRKDKPIEGLIGNDDPTTCGHCGARTEYDHEADHGHGQMEKCIHCGQRYDVEYLGEIDVVDAKGKVVGTTVKPIQEASQADLDHLFGIKREDRAWAEIELIEGTEPGQCRHCESQLGPINTLPLAEGRFRYACIHCKQRYNYKAIPNYENFGVFG